MAISLSGVLSNVNNIREVTRDRLPAASHSQTSNCSPSQALIRDHVSNSAFTYFVSPLSNRRLSVCLSVVCRLSVTCMRPTQAFAILSSDEVLVLFIFNVIHKVLLLQEAHQEMR